jgi:nucleoside-diphosphate-sugar epimerase
VARIAVTGGAGFIGGHLVAALLQDGYAVSVLDTGRSRTEPPAALVAATVVRGDIRDAERCRAAFAGCDAVVHLAAQSTVMGSEQDPEACFATNVLGSWCVMEAARAAGARHVVFASSREVYGEPASLPVAEDAPLRARNAYGASKIAGEALLTARADAQLGVSILRLANVIGAGDRGRVVPRWIDAARAGEPLVLYGGEQQMDFVPVDTVVTAFQRTLGRGPLDGPVNVGSGRTTTLHELARRIVAAFPSSSTVTVHPPRGPEVTRYCADLTRMRRVLGIDPPADPLAHLAEYGSPQ